MRTYTFNANTFLPLLDKSELRSRLPYHDWPNFQFPVQKILLHTPVPPVTNRIILSGIDNTGKMEKELICCCGGDVS